MTNEIELKEAAILEAIKQLSIEVKAEQKYLKDKIEKIEGNVNDLKIGQAEIKAELKGLDQRMTATENRINSQGNWFVSILAILVTGILTILGKIVFFGNNF